MRVVPQDTVHAPGVPLSHPADHLVLGLDIHLSKDRVDIPGREHAVVLEVRADPLRLVVSELRVLLDHLDDDLIRFVGGREQLCRLAWLLLGLGLRGRLLRSLRLLRVAAAVADEPAPSQVFLDGGLRVVHVVPSGYLVRRQALAVVQLGPVVDLVFGRASSLCHAPVTWVAEG